MKISKISDLKIGENYFLCFVKDARFSKKCQLIGIINESTEHPDNGMTELYVKFSNSTNLVYCHEIGIGITKIEAKNNYGKFNYEINDKFSNSIKRVKALTDESFLTFLKLLEKNQCSAVHFAPASNIGKSHAVKAAIDILDKISENL